MNCPFDTGSSNLRPIPFPSALKTSTLAFSRVLKTLRRETTPAQHRSETRDGRVRYWYAIAARRLYGDDRTVHGNKVALL